MRPLTKRQEQIFELIKVFIKDTGMPPTRAEIADALGFKSANAAEEHLKALAKKGVIEMVPGASRGIRLVEDESEQLGLPIIGRVAAGEPILAEQHVESHFNVDASFFKPNADYLLRVNGMSMKDIGILDGDLLAVHRTQVAENGQVIVARVEEDVTVKRLEKKGKKVFLHAENEEFKAIEVDLEHQNFSIEGLAVGVIRNADWM
ncbi:repressor LexA [Pseudoalteromonas sp. HM-SA03]|uniref:transcriptional repressor LexA n=1 Tax=Pseudoalteromonas sp. HM-SA03 TaxID=2029678 RepID=UPI000BAE2A0D|nr:transcriptional repressor LexA [Pseudoalteromonas sp. HM-SA03]PAY01399.1 repressor LexA [Pseudoalteromonas sp. HM-SA03]